MLREGRHSRVHGEEGRGLRGQDARRRRVHPGPWCKFRTEPDGEHGRHRGEPGVLLPGTVHGLGREGDRVELERKHEGPGLGFGQPVKVAVPVVQRHRELGSVLQEVQVAEQGLLLLLAEVRPERGGVVVFQEGRQEDEGEEEHLRILVPVEEATRLRVQLKRRRALDLLAHLQRAQVRLPRVLFARMVLQGPARPREQRDLCLRLLLRWERARTAAAAE